MRKNLIFSSFLILLLLSSGCMEQGGGDDDDSSLEVPLEYSYSMKLSDEEPSAGQVVTITHAVTDQFGKEWTDNAEISVEVDPADGVTINEEGKAVIFEKAIPHRVIGVAVISGTVLRDEVSVNVKPGEANSIDLSLNQHEVRAGEEVLVSYDIYDAYMNSIKDGYSVEITIDPSEGTTVSNNTVTATIAQYYTVTGTISGTLISDSEILSVVPNEPHSIDLELSTTDIEKGDTVEAEVSIYDMYGNLCDEPYNLLSDPTEGVTISGDDITFNSEGWFTVIAEVSSNTSIYDTVGPFLIDSSGPIITITNPARGSYQSSSPIEVRGQVYDLYSEVDYFILNGVEIELDSSGNFTTTMIPSIGINILEGEAIDSDGNERTVAQSFLYGTSFIPTGSQVPGAFIARINQGTIDIIEDEVIASIDLSSIESQIIESNPVMSEEEEQCFWWGCITLYSAYVNVTSVYFDNPDIQIDPMTGYIRVEFSVNNLRVNFSAYGEIMEVDYTTSGNVSSSRAVVNADAFLTADSSGNIYVTLSNVSVSLEGFRFDVDNFPSQLEDLLQDYLRELAEDALEDAVYDEVPPAISDALEDLDLSTTLNILDQEFTLSALITNIQIDDAGITIGLDTIIGVTEDPSYSYSPGSLYTPSAFPSYSSTPGFALSLADDFLNSATHSIWVSGVLEYSLTDEELGIDPDDLEGLPFELTEFDLTLTPLLPPVIIPGNGTSGVEIQVGDLILEMYSDISGTYSLMVQLSISMFADADISITDTNEISITINDITFYFDVLASDSETMQDTEFERLLQDLVPYLIPLLTSYLESFPVPDFEGYHISGMTVFVDGPSLDYLTVSGDLTTM